MSEGLSRLRAIWQHTRADVSLQASVFTRWRPLYEQVFNSRWTLLFLLLVSVVRAVFFLVAYPPAGGADGGDYFLYAAYIAGYDLPDQVASVSTLYPLFIAVNYYLTGNFDLMLLWQVIMSVSLGLIMYLGLRRYNALLAVLVALVVLGDAQIGIIFNFFATEPLYIFLLCLVFALAVAVPSSDMVLTRVRTWQGVVLGVLLVLIRETRTVARYLFVPVMVLYALYTRNLRAVVSMLASFVLMTLLFSLTLTTADVEQTTSVNDRMILRPLFEYGLLDPDAGPASERLNEMWEICRTEEPDMSTFRCVDERYDGALSLSQQAYQEALRQNPFAMLERNVQAFHEFLLMSGHQFYGEQTPAHVQCADIATRLERHIDQTLNSEWALISVTPEQITTLRTVSEGFMQEPCPVPDWQNDTARQVTEWLGERYRSLSRPNPYLWNAVLFLLILVLPFARRYWYPFVMAGTIWVYHAAVSAAVINVQPRYVLVTNPMKAVLVVMLIVVLVQVLVRLLDAILSQRERAIESVSQTGTD